ncbi:hypothetical protein JOS77_07325 [Chromobacterium haemolyticum]|nr:hypothetical protein JOS77_07325 [Chromobacterium haemolyticum]
MSRVDSCSVIITSSARGKPRRRAELPASPFLALTLSTSSGSRPRSRSWLRAARAESASSKPFCSLPAGSKAVKRKAAISSSSPA